MVCEWWKCYCTQRLGRCPQKKIVSSILRSILRCMKGEIKIEAALNIFKDVRESPVFWERNTQYFFMNLYHMCNNNPWGKKLIQFFQHFKMTLGFPDSASGKEPVCRFRKCETQVHPWLRKIPEEGVVTHSNILAWEIPWTEQPGGLQSIGSQRVRHSWSDLLDSMHTRWRYMFW